MNIYIYKSINIYIYIHTYLSKWVQCASPPPTNGSNYSLGLVSLSFSGISKDLCTFHKSCARFIEAVHVSQNLCAVHTLPNNVRVQLRPKKQNHGGDQSHFSDLNIDTYIYIIHISIRKMCIYRYINISRYISIYLSIYLFIYLSIYLSIYIYIYISE